MPVPYFEIFRSWFSAPPHDRTDLDLSRKPSQTSCKGAIQFYSYYVIKFNNEIWEAALLSAQMKAHAWGVYLPCFWGPVELSNVLKIGENGSALSFNNRQTTSPRELILVNMKECCSSASNKVQHVSHLTPRKLLFHRRGLSLRNIALTIPWKMMFYVTAR